MEPKFSIYRIMGALLVLEVVLLVTSGIPAIKNAEHGWKHVLGSITWGGFLLTTLVLIMLAVTALVRRRRPTQGQGQTR